ncbi:MAG: GvpL/GvpF family gas vesicle protein [Pseudomonadota bacterium]
MTEQTRCYCYAVGRADWPEPDGAIGIDNAPIRLCRGERFTLIVSAAGAETYPPKRRYLKAHTALLEHLGVSGTLLPMRFGTVATSEAEAINALEPQIRALSEMLDRFDGKQEFGLRVEVDEQSLLKRVLSDDPALRAAATHQRNTAGTPQTAQIALGQRVSDALERLRRTEQKALLTLISPHIEDHVLRAPEHPSMLLKADLLVAKGREDGLVSALERYGASENARMHLVGPAPLYSFVDLRLPAIGAAAA